MSGFTEKDREKLVQFLNFVATKAEFNQMKSADVISYFGLLSFMQKELLPKVDSHIFEIKSVIEPVEEKTKSKSKKG